MLQNTDMCGKKLQERVCVDVAITLAMMVFVPVAVTVIVVLGAAKVI